MPLFLAERIDAVIERALAERRLVGTVVLAAHDGKQIYHRAAGLADRETNQPMRENQLFRLASVSKPIVSTAAMVLAGQGRLQLDDSVTRWLPTFRPASPDGAPARITVRQLLTHTAGLGYRFLESEADGPYARAGVSDGMDDAGITLEENLRRIASVPLAYVPGTGWGYSLATDVLGALIERLVDAPLGDAVGALVSGPLDMHDTAFHAIDAARLATAYVDDTPAPHRLRELETVSAFEGTVGIHYSPARALDRGAFPSGGAGMVGTAGDVLRLLETLHQGGGALLPAPLAAELGRNQTGELGPPDAPGYGFGLGFSVLRDPHAADSPESAGTWRWGGAYGHSWFVDPHRRLSVVALTNTLYEGMSGRFVRELRDAVYGSAMHDIGDARP